MNEKKVPQHISIVPDGNRRWAKQRGLIATAGHVKAGRYENLKNLLNTAKEVGVKYVSLWAFSTENWKRNKNEVDEILRVVEKAVDGFIKDEDKEGMRFRHLGRKDRLPKSLLDKIKRLEEETKDFDEYYVLLCLDYGGRDEIVRAVNKVVSQKKNVDELEFSNFLDTAGIPDPELVIRTGGNTRLSGWMLWQTQYSEFYFTDVLFPDFDSKELKKAIEWFRRVRRRFGE